MTEREMQAFLEEMYAIEASPDLISTVTDAVAAKSPSATAAARAAVSRRVLRRVAREIHDEAMVRGKAIHLALAVLLAARGAPSFPLRSPRVACPGRT